MITVSPEHAGVSRPEVHQVRDLAESFGVDAARYDRTRPRYPDALVERIRAASPGPEFVDVGCGTGIAARQFQAAGCTVLGVEPDPRMADVARRGGVEVETATVESWAPAGRTFDAVVAGTAWHWVDPAAGAAKAGEVLRPGGLLAPFWHVFQLPPAVAATLAAAYQRVAPDAPLTFPADRQGLAAYQPLFTGAAEGIRAAGGFGEPTQWHVDWDQPYTRDELLEMLATHGQFTALAPEAVAQVLAEVGAAVDARGGSLTVRYTTVAVTAVRQSPRPDPRG
ncbi:class I SAM-dependent methyltransferase [Micromonospora fluostatini]|uniref:Class I SAM-dependent methyltransferase n=1 Tax=Micromonospora fluostatini TaxID=1629071 RepID=A0ABY2DP12_9ACTN|nr:class I SAM-dependent methyltransferase [Micromonospora fluostatini]